MPKHPLYETFQELLKREANNFIPSCESSILKRVQKAPDIHKMGCIVLAGGQGSRLGFRGPKGCVELPLKEKKTLFQLLFEKVREKGAHLPLAIMTSPLNHKATIEYLEKHRYFGLTELSFFQQEMLPLCDDEGNCFGSEIAPDGNGKALAHFYHAGIWDQWKERGVEFIQVLPIDNPLADPFDLELLGVHQEQKVDLVLRCVKRKSTQEAMGIVGEYKGKLTVLEYSDRVKPLSLNQFKYGNTGVFSCSLNFVREVSNLHLPWHKARKQSNGTWIWKFETFIFDLFPYAKSFKLLVEARKKCFAPLKNLSGPDGLEAVAEALMTFNP